MLEAIKGKTTKFGVWNRKTDISVQCPIPLFGNNIYLNCIFEPLECEKRQKFDSVHQEYLGCVFSKELAALYATCNGFSLFSDSLVLFGIGLETCDGLICKDIIQENNWLANVNFFQKYPDLYSFGYYGSFMFCLKKDGSSGVVVIHMDDLSVKKQFASVRDTYCNYIDKLASIYDNNGLKINVDPNKKRILSRNRSTEEL